MLPRLLILVVIALCGICPGPLRAQVSGSYINPFPEGDVYKLQAYGDAFADGLLPGLSESFNGDNRVDVARRPRTLAGLTRNEFDDEMRNEENVREPLHIAIVMVGLNDRIPFRAATGQRYLVGSPEWRDEYGRRVERLVRTLRRRNAAVYWVGLPVMRRNDVNDDAQMMNDIVRQKAYLNGIKYIDTQAQFADDAGNFTPYGPDLTGRNRVLREGDGITFTAAGNRKLAHFIEQELKRDLLQARSERDIPLAGNEVEQRRVAALRPRPQPADPAWKGTVTVTKADRAATRASQGDVPGELKADNGRVTLGVMGASGRVEAVTMDLLRPPVSGAVVALLTRRDTGERASQMGETVADEISGGLVVLSSITPATNPGQQGTARRFTPSQMPYYSVLVKGERVATKPGRSDDFAWPPKEPDFGFPPSAGRADPARPPAVPVRRNPRLGSRDEMPAGRR